MRDPAAPLPRVQSHPTKTGGLTIQPLQDTERAPASEAQTSRTMEVYRFVVSERFLHWALAIPFVVLYLTAAAMLLLWSEPAPRVFHAGASWIHKIFDVALTVLPPLVLLRGRSQWRVHVGNITEAWSWTRNDFAWLLLSPVAAMNSRVQLPEQGRFNAAEKLNFMMVSATYPLYIATGILIWLPGAWLAPWYLHLAMAALGVALVIGHIFMAAVNPSTKAGLQGMITGWVDKEWAKHHYRQWYRENFEGSAAKAVAEHRASLKKPAKVRCTKCGETRTFRSWERLLQRTLQVEPLYCTKCEAEIGSSGGSGTSGLATEVLQHLAQSGAAEPLAR